MTKYKVGDKVRVTREWLANEHGGPFDTVVVRATRDGYAWVKSSHYPKAGAAQSDAWLEPIPQAEAVEVGDTIRILIYQFGDKEGNEVEVSKVGATSIHYKSKRDPGTEYYAYGYATGNDLGYYEGKKYFELVRKASDNKQKEENVTIEFKEGDKIIATKKNEGKPDTVIVGRVTVVFSNTEGQRNFAIDAGDFEVDIYEDAGWSFTKPEKPWIPKFKVGDKVRITRNTASYLYEVIAPLPPSSESPYSLTREGFNGEKRNSAQEANLTAEPNTREIFAKLPNGTVFHFDEAKHFPYVKVAGKILVLGTGVTSYVDTKNPSFDNLKINVDQEPPVV